MESENKDKDIKLTNEKQKEIVLKQSNELIEQITEVLKFILFDKSFLNNEEKNVLIDLLKKIRSEGIEKDYDINENPAIIKEWLENYAYQYPKEFSFYVNCLRQFRQKIEQKVNQAFNIAIKDLKPDEKIIKNLNQLTISLDKSVSLKHKLFIKEIFKSGVFFMHTTDIDSFIATIRTGQLLTAKELSYQKRGEEVGRGGDAGISFNMNGVTVMRGTLYHFVGFVAPIENILKPEWKLAVPSNAAWGEVQLLSNDPEEKQLPNVDINNTFIMCSDSDVNRIKNLIASYNKKPLGILTYPSISLRVESWVFTRGDALCASDLIQNLIWETGKREPLIKWGDMFPIDPERDPIMPNFVSSESIKIAKEIILDNHGKSIIRGV